jgi:hypothetical protein
LTTSYETGAYYVLEKDYPNGDCDEEERREITLWMSNLPVRDTLEMYARNWGNEDH